MHNTICPGWRDYNVPTDENCPPKQRSTSQITRGVARNQRAYGGRVGGYSKRRRQMQDCQQIKQRAVLGSTHGGSHGGVPWDVIVGRLGAAVPVEIQDNGDVTVRDEEDEEHEARMDEEDNVEIKFKGGPDKFHASRKAIETYGPTEGCLACSIIQRRGHMKGRIGYNQNDICRDRVKQLMTNAPEYRSLMEKHYWGSDNGKRRRTSI